MPYLQGRGIGRSQPIVIRQLISRILGRHRKRAVAAGAVATALIAAGSGLAGLGIAGVIEFEGMFRLTVNAQPTALIRGGFVAGPHLPGPFLGQAPYEAAFVVCCAEDPDGGTLSYEWDFTYDGVTFLPEITGPGPVTHV